VSSIPKPTPTPLPTNSSASKPKEFRNDYVRRGNRVRALHSALYLFTILVCRCIYVEATSGSLLGCWTFDVRCSTFDAGRSTFGPSAASFSLNSAITASRSLRDTYRGHTSSKSERRYPFATCSPIQDRLRPREGNLRAGCWTKRRVVWDIIGMGEPGPFDMLEESAPPLFSTEGLRFLRQVP
jgi:hypothetical protein